MRIIRVKNNTEETIELLGIQIASEEFYDIPPEEVDNWSLDEDIHKAIYDRNIIISDGDKDIDGAVMSSLYLMGNSSNSTSINIEKDENGRIKVSLAPDPHNATHGKDQPDELNVTDLSGILADEQKPIPSKCIEAMGAKNNSNPLNHDRFTQREIHNLPENQLNLNYSTHDNSNDLTSSQKQAIDNAVSPSAENPFVTMSDRIAGPQGPQGIQGEQGAQGIQGVKGEKGDTGDKGDTGERGEAFYISATYSSISEMNTDISNILEGHFVLINTDNVNDENNGKVFLKQNNSMSFIVDLSGADGIQGPQGIQGVQGIKGDKGDQGIQGEQGPQGIQGVQGAKGDKGDQGEKGDIGDTLKRQFYINIKKASDSSIYDGSIFYNNNKKKTLDWNGYTSDNYGQIMVPFDCIVKGLLIKFKGASWSGVAPDGNIRIGLSVYEHLIYNADRIKKIYFTLGNEYTTSFAERNDKTLTQKKTSQFEIIEGNNQFQAGDLIGFTYLSPSGQDGDVYRLRNVHLTLILEEI